MTFRLFEGYFNTSLRNLSIGGGSPLTGLSIISSYRSLPRIILVETNIMSRPVDETLVREFGDNVSESFKWFRPARATISWLYYWIKFHSEAETVRQLPMQQPGEYNISKSVDEAIKEHDGRDWERAMRSNVDDLIRLVSELERRGCKVFFFELPSVYGIERSDYAVAARRLTRNAVPDVERWMTLINPDNQLRWLDAFHMDERSAIIVARQIDQFLNNVSR
ncbi:MAG: hypothetical protein WAV72_05670 [Bradyrhizobium sp.]